MFREMGLRHDPRSEAFLCFKHLGFQTKKAQFY
jgi:hypothetical protein